MSLRALVAPPRIAPQLAPYWAGVAQHELRLPRCSACGAWEWYPAAGGPACAGAHYEWCAMSAGATVFTFTHVERPLLAGVTESYLVGLVSPDDAPACRVVTRLDAPGRDLRIGARARLAFSGNGPLSIPYFIVEADS